MCVPEANFPLESICLGFYHNDVVVIGMIEAYYQAGATEKARDLAERFSIGLLESVHFYMEYYEYARHDFELCCNCLYYLADTVKSNGDQELSDKLMKAIDAIMNLYSYDSGSEN